MWSRSGDKSLISDQFLKIYTSFLEFKGSVVLQYLNLFYYFRNIIIDRMDNMLDEYMREMVDSDPYKEDFEAFESDPWRHFSDFWQIFRRFQEYFMQNQENTIEKRDLEVTAFTPKCLTFHYFQQKVSILWRHQVDFYEQRLMEILENPWYLPADPENIK